jgi:hypothetical protein
MRGEERTRDLGSLGRVAWARPRAVMAARSRGWSLGRRWAASVLRGRAPGRGSKGPGAREGTARRGHEARGVAAARSGWRGAGRDRAWAQALAARAGKGKGREGEEREEWVATGLGQGAAVAWEGQGATTGLRGPLVGF